MVIAKKVKCPLCNNMNDKANAIRINNRYYCKECGEKRKSEIKKNTSDWDELYEYICKIYNKKPTGMMFKQLKEFRDKPYNFTNKGMELTLKYFYETLGKEVKDDTGLGIIPYYYDKAKQHFIDIIKVKKYMDEFNCEEIEKNIKVKKTNINDKVIKRKQLSFKNISWEVDK